MSTSDVDVSPWYYFGVTHRSLLSALSGGLEGWAVAFFGDQAEQILVNAPAQRRHVCCAIWSQFSMRADRIYRPDDLDQWRDNFQRLSSRVLLRRAGFGRATGLLGTLAKLGWMALEKPRAYLSLADTLEADGAQAKLLRHLTLIDLRAIELVATMPNAACSAKTFAILRANSRVTPMTLKRLAWRHNRVAAVHAERLADTPSTISAAFIESGDLNNGLPFPAPPWIGTTSLKPLDTLTKLERAALHFENCLANQTRYVCAGTTYFYELDRLAIVEFERVADLGWEIVEARGPKNEAMSLQASASLARELARAPGHISRILPSFGDCYLND